MKKPVWVLRASDDASRKAEYAPGTVRNETIQCTLKDGHLRPGKRLTPLSVILSSRRPGNFVSTWLSDFLLGQEALNIFRNENFTGFDVKEVNTHLKNSNEKAPELWEIIITGWGGIAPSSTGIRLVESCPGCGLLKYSVPKDAAQLFNDSQWDGSDFFMIWPLPRYIFISDRVARVIKKAELTGAAIQEYKSLKFNSDGLTPGRLSLWMPNTRAKELGEPLGIY